MDMVEYRLQRDVGFAEEQLTKVVHAVLLVREGNLRIVWVVEQDPHFLQTVELMEHRGAEYAISTAEANESVPLWIYAVPMLSCSGARNGEVVRFVESGGDLRPRVFDRKMFRVVVADVR